MNECKGMNCGATTGPHSCECLAQHAAAVAGGTFVKDVPYGPWKLVPVEPTEEMINAGFEGFGMRGSYSAMLAAAPQPPSVGVEQDEDIVVAVMVGDLKPQWHQDPFEIEVGTELVDRAHVTARDQQIAEITEERDMYRAVKEIMRRYNNEANEQIAELQDSCASADALIEQMKGWYAALEKDRDALKARVAELEKVLGRIAADPSCGCKPCTGDCISKYALEIAVDEMREEARTALAQQVTK